MGWAARHCSLSFVMSITKKYLLNFFIGEIAAWSFYQSVNLSTCQSEAGCVLHWAIVKVPYPRDEWRRPRRDIPILSAISAARSPQIPLMAIRTLSPGSTVLKMAHSMAVWPEPLTAIVMLFCVWKAYWIPFLMSFIIWRRNKRSTAPMMKYL